MPTTPPRPIPRQPRPAVLVALALAAVLAALAAGAQVKPRDLEQLEDLLGRNRQPPPAVFLDRVDVEIVNLDVVVTDRRGNPIDGLTRDDFVLRVDGRLTPIDNFYAVGPASPAAAEASGAVAAPASTAASGEAAAGVPPLEQELHVLVLFDNLYATPGERVRVVEELAAAFEDGLGSRGRAAVAYYDGGIRVSQPFTTDGAAVAAAIRATAEGQVRYGDDLERRRLLREIEQVRFGEPTAGVPRRDLGPGTSRAEDGRAADDGDELLDAIHAYSEQQAVEVRRRLMALTWKVESLAGLPGRKALLYVSSGLDLRPGQVLFSAWRNKFSALGRRVGTQASLARASNLETAAGGPDLAEALRELVRRANGGGVVLYAVGTAGTGTSHSISAEQGGFELETFSTSVGSFALDQGLDTAFRANLGAGLEMMAEVTGGDALTGAADYDRIAERIEQDAGHRYSLGFRAPESEPGTSHRVEVELAGYQAKLRYRHEFVTATPAQRAAERTRAALVWDHADNGLGVIAEVGPTRPSEHGEDYVELPVLVKVPFVNLVLVPEQQVHHGRITIFVVAEDDDGRTSPVQSLEAPIRVPAAMLEETRRGVAGYRMSLVVRPGPHRLAIGVRDEVGDAVSSVVLEHDVETPRDAV